MIHDEAETRPCGRRQASEDHDAKEELDLYAAEHDRLYGPVETAALIPHMFLRSDLTA